MVRQVLLSLFLLPSRGIILTGDEQVSGSPMERIQVGVNGHFVHASDSKLEATLKRMEYWTPGTSAKEVGDKYLIFTPDNGGPNNIRIGWEMSGLVAQKTGRTLVLPPARPMYLLDMGPSKRMPSEIRSHHTMTAVEDMINLAQLKASLPTVTAKEFEERTAMKWDDAVKQSERVSKDDVCKMSAYNKIDGAFLFMPGDGHVENRREGFGCAAWWLMGGPKEELKTETNDADWSLLTHGFVWHPDAFDIASHAVAQLGIFDYNALHARYNDFQFHDEQKEPDEIFNGSMSLLQTSPKVYVASDDPDRIRNLKGLKGEEVTTFDDLVNTGALKDVKQKYSPERWFKMLGPAEELICTYAKVFVGTGHSTFSGHINRMRVHAQAPTIRSYTFGDNYHDIYKGDSNALDNAKKDIADWDQSGKKASIMRVTPLAGDAFLEELENDDAK